MSEAISGAPHRHIEIPGCRFAHPGYGYIEHAELEYYGSPIP
jgi:hypothetical protein